MKKVLCLLFLLSLSSCSSIHYLGRGQVEVNVASSQSVKKIKVISEKTYEFLLWGNVPLQYEVELGNELNIGRIARIGNISIIQYQTFLDQMLSFFSLGLYTRYQVKIQGWGDVITREL